MLTFWMRLAKQVHGGVAVESRFALNNVWSPMLGRGILGEAALGNLFFHLEQRGGEGAAPNQEHNRSLVSRCPSRGRQCSFNTAEQMHTVRQAPPHHGKNTVYINLAGCWIIFGRAIYEVEKNHVVRQNDFPTKWGEVWGFSFQGG